MSGSSSVKAFADAAIAPERSAKPKPPPPFSIRLTHEERARLKRKAGKLPLGAFIRRELLGEEVAPRKPQHLRKPRQPTMDQAMLARLLGMFGQSELGRSMIALALAAQSGALPVTPEVSEKLAAACNDIREMRTALIEALNLKPEDGG